MIEVARRVSADEIREAVKSGKIKLQANPEASLNALGHMLPTLIEGYSGMKWTVLISVAQPFVTSDAPVCRHYPHTSSLGAGLLNRDLKVYFPISHNRALLLTHDHAKEERFKKLQRQGLKREARRLIMCTPEIAYQNVSGEETERINRLIIERAYRWTYAPVEIEYVGRFFVGEPRNIRMETNFIEGPNLIQLTSRFR